MMSMCGWWFLAIVLLLTFEVSQVKACFAVIVGREASADGSVLVGHNEENYGQQVLNFRRVPRGSYEPGAAVRLRRGGELPEVRETWAFLWSEIPGAEFSDGYLNEWGVTVVSDACRTREDEYDTLVGAGEIRNGGIGYMLRRLVAQRATSAREGVQLAGALVERFGYVHSGRTYVIADPNEAWLLSVVCGRRWVARRVPDGSVAVLPNVHIIAEVNLADADNFLACRDLIDYAVRRGWFDPDAGQPFSFSKAYRAEDQEAVDPRRWWAQQLILGRRGDGPPQGALPFAVKPARKMTVASVAAILRDRSGPVPLHKLVTQESAVFELRASMPREIGCVYWRTTARPAVSVYTPWYLGITETPDRYYRPVTLQTQLTLDHHFQPPEGTYDPDPRLAWWQFQALQDAADEDYERRAPTVQKAWSAFEDRAFRRQPSVEQKAAELWETDQDAARAYLTRYSAELSAQACREAVRLTETLSKRQPARQP